MTAKRHNVRLTEEAHSLLTQRTEGSGVSMKDAASEAVMSMFKQKRDNSRYAFGAFALGSIAGGVLMFFAGMPW